MPSTIRYRWGDVVLVAFPLSDMSGALRRPNASINKAFKLSVATPCQFQPAILQNLLLDGCSHLE
jgi:hypothetical protein